MAYKAFVAKIDSIHPIDNADRIVRAVVLGNSVIVGKDAKVGDIGILFPDGGQLSPEYCEANDLIVRRDENGKKIGGGFFDHKRRVKTQTFRGCKSEAYFAQLESVDFVGEHNLKLGDKFTELNGVPICNKYISSASKRMAGDKKSSKKTGVNSILKERFKQHFDTEQFRLYADSVPTGSLITITHKLHGTSGRAMNCLVPKKLNWFQRFINKTLFKSKMVESVVVHGSRRVIFTEGKTDSYYGGIPFREVIFNKFKDMLEPGEAVYYEIVGYSGGNVPIMVTHNTNNIQDKRLRKQVESCTGTKGVMTYKYGCLEGEYDIYVYRITKTDIDGNVFEYPWNQVKVRCKALGLKHVPEVIDHFICPTSDELKMVVEKLTEEEPYQDVIDASHIREGICIRADTPDGRTKIYKNKTFPFRVMEGIVKEDCVDVEDI